MTPTLIKKDKKIIGAIDHDNYPYVSKIDDILLNILEAALLEKLKEIDPK